jgi:hypothetical protein
VEGGDYGLEVHKSLREDKQCGSTWDARRKTEV